MSAFVALSIVSAALAFCLWRLNNYVNDLRLKLLIVEDALKAARREIAQLQPKRDARGHFVKTKTP